jgi:hypothetical protein
LPAVTATFAFSEKVVPVATSIHFEMPSVCRPLMRVPAKPFDRVRRAVGAGACRDVDLAEDVVDRGDGLHELQRPRDGVVARDDQDFSRVPAPTGATPRLFLAVPSALTIFARSRARC